MDKFVSVVVTCYNHENFIGQCLNSIFKQSYRNFRLLVINDGSTDNSDLVIQEHLSREKTIPIQYVSQENIGLSQTRNKALQIIQGDFVLFVDSDNFLDENYIEEMVSVAELENVDIVYSALKNAESGQVISQARDFDLAEFYIGNFIDSCSLVRINKIGGVRYDPKYKKLEDYDFFFNLIISNGAIASPCFNTFLNYRVLDNSMSSHGDLLKYYQAYSRIVAKYSHAYPEYAEKALHFNFSQLLKLDIEHSIREEKLEIFLSDTEEFSQTPQFIFPIRSRDDIEIMIESNCSHIRIRPSNIPSFYKSFEVIGCKNEKSIFPSLSNGIVINNQIIFMDFYPFIDYRQALSPGEKLIIKYQRFNIGDIVADDYIAKVLGREVYEQQEYIRHLEETNKELDNLLHSVRPLVNYCIKNLCNKFLNLFRRK
ncbi:glycosyltransferase family 2 protein [Streptococcus sp. S784/96/1]|uniref:glycosyltransferase family 2 protein n=1 Tax=Streptococcus sp. S784/96/1 TaxID=2653499 RepID=UPI00138A278E|nr:glycosyltransferase family 2 protein [Streptococcus sp. S784/96/1]